MKESDVKESTAVNDDKAEVKEVTPKIVNDEAERGDATKKLQKMSEMIRKTIENMRGKKRKRVSFSDKVEVKMVEKYIKELLMNEEPVLKWRKPRLVDVSTTTYTTEIVDPAPPQSDMIHEEPYNFPPCWGYCFCCLCDRN